MVGGSSSPISVSVNCPAHGVPRKWRVAFVECQQLPNILSLETGISLLYLSTVVSAIAVGEVLFGARDAIDIVGRYRGGLPGKINAESGR